MHYVIQRMYKRDPNWISLRFSYGFNGILLKKNDLKSLIIYLKKNFYNGPCDWLYYQWCKESKRKFYTYRNNLFYHIGEITTFFFLNI
jgi:hypothetical protein